MPPATAPTADWLDEEIAALRESVELISTGRRARRSIVPGGWFRLMSLRTSRGEGSGRKERRPTPRHPARFGVSAPWTLRLVHVVPRAYGQDVLWYVVAVMLGVVAGLLVALMAGGS